MSKLFYCYSNRLNIFLEAFGVEYVDKGKHELTQREYKVYPKSEKLEYLLEEWDKIKKVISLQSVREKNKEI